MAGNLALCQGEVVDIRNASMNWLPAEVEVSLNSFALARSHLSTGVHFSTWELAARKSGSEYNFNGSIYSKTFTKIVLYSSNPTAQQLERLIRTPGVVLLLSLY
ncbi:uncharacterized protein LAJ45_06506 [Morchella importuna]|uniref:uncharacterized protein n=1 Tax=Morchella importuna TaxID=1174673 RepID=UPI001E8EA98F|nr:uncharacterized protein LAJ45_06506 [Morchella importuna]KAH8149427.1 hypothetical protein LAJ45_06506 [Morchella importuna]